MPSHSHPGRCAAVGLDAAFLRRVRDSAAGAGLRVDAAPGLEDPAVATADVVLVASSAARVRDAVGSGARAIVACVAHGDTDGLAAAFDEGADDVVTPRTHGREVVARIRAVIVRRREERGIATLARLARPSRPRFLGRSAAIRGVQRILPQIAGTSVPVRIEGEPGTGRVLAARVLHDLSPRRDRPLLVVDAAAAGPVAARALLFGGVDEDCGALWSGDGGTVLVRSADRLDPETQSLLARWLQTGLVPAGPHAGDASDARLLVTSDGPLDAAGRASPDFVAALSSVRVGLPALRDRKGDAEVLLSHFLHETGSPVPVLAAAARRLLDDHPWPGNVPEIRALAVILRARGPFATLDEADLVPLLAFPRPRRPGPGALDSVPTLRDVELGHIVRVVALAGGVRSEAAKALGISTRTIYNHLGGRERPGRPARAKATT